MPNFAGANRKDYGYTHQRTRAALFAALPDGSPCARCGRPMNKAAKDRQGRSALHLDHDEHGTYLGFSHRTCNMRAGASKGGRIALAKRRARLHPRPWQAWHSRTW